MTLDEARRIMERTVWSGMGDQPEALRVILAALPAPEKRTPGRTSYDRRQLVRLELDGLRLIVFDHLPDGCKTAEEAGSLAVLREHAVDFAFEKITPRDINELWARFPSADSHEDLARIKAEFLAKVKARLAEVKP